MVGLRFLPAVALVALVACESTDDLFQSPYDADEDRFNTLINDISNRAPTDPRSLPTSGSASYDGVLGFNTRLDGSRQSVLGDLDLTSDFRNNEVFGTAGDFHTEADRTVGGLLTIDNGVIRRGPNAQNTIGGAGVRGVLTSPGGDTLTYQGTMNGNFYGANWVYVGGTLRGTVDDGVRINNADGSFAAQR